jgi:hypothetical protein
MIRTKATLAVAACIAGVVSGSIAAAQADTSSTGASGATGATAAPAASITVNGTGTVSVDSSESSAVLQAAYLTALGSALTDAHTHATTLSGAVGDTLGAVETITEQSSDGGNICGGPLFAAGSARGAPVPVVSPGTSKKKSHSSKPKSAAVAIPAIARIADDSSTTCTVEADITVTYAMAPS